uniref:Glutathione reductase n=1 Tax=Vibrio coralliilyticus TaxID=190893 RepID=M1FW52_9VIBR|nr:glutathione reductase [Vibrio coralliilyticus]
MQSFSSIHPLGGTRVNVGGVPKKVMWHGAQLMDEMKLYAEDYGISYSDMQVNYSKLVLNREKYIDRLHTVYKKGLDSNGVDLIKGFAKFVDNHTIEVNGEQYTADHILIATGGYPERPNIPGQEYGIDSDGFFALTELPKRVAIIGAGYIAVELAGVTPGLGADTHLFVRRNAPLRTFDSIISEGLVETMEREGATLHTHSIPKKLKKKKNNSLTIYLKDGSSHTTDTIIWAIGRKPNTANLNLEPTDVELNPEGEIGVHDYGNPCGVFILGWPLEVTPRFVFPHYMGCRSWVAFGVLDAKYYIESAKLCVLGGYYDIQYPRNWMARGVTQILLLRQWGTWALPHDLLVITYITTLDNSDMAESIYLIMVFNVLLALTLALIMAFRGAT